MKEKRMSKVLYYVVSIGIVIGLVMPSTMAKASERVSAEIASDLIEEEIGVNWNTFTKEKTEDVNKTWIILLNDFVDARSVHESTVYVQSQSGELFPTSLDVRENVIEVQPLYSYEEGQLYELIILSDVMSLSGIKMKENVKLPFEIQKGEEESDVIIEEVEVEDYGHGSMPESFEPLKTTVDKETNKPEALVSYLNEEGRKAIEVYQSSSHDDLFDTLNLMKVSVSNEEFKGIQKNPNIEYVERNVVFEDSLQNEKAEEIIRLGSVFETESGDLAHWGYDSLGLEGAFQQGITGKGVKVAIIDSGVSNHDDLKVVGGTSRVDYTDSYADDNGHGTHIAGVIASKLDGQGMVGIAPDSKIYSVKVVDEKGKGSVSDIALGLVWAMGSKMDVVNISIGSKYYSPIYEKVLQQVTDAGIPVVTSAGNEGTSNPNEETIIYPAKYDSTIAVGAINENLVRPSTSATGETLDLVAPGDKIVSTSYEGGYISKSGTSMAAPQVTGMIALLKQAFPNKSVEEYKEMLINEAVDLGPEGFDTGYGHGFVSFENLFPYESEEPEVIEPDEEESEKPEKEEENSNSKDLYWATAYVESVEEVNEGKRDKYAKEAVFRVNNLPKSKEKEELIKRMQALGYMLPVDPNAPIIIKTTDLKRAELFVGQAEEKETSSNVYIAKVEVMWLPASYERDQFLERMHKLGYLLDVELSGLPEGEAIIEEEEEEVYRPDPDKSPEYNIAERYVTFAEEYGTDYHKKIAVELTLELEPSEDRNILLERLKALGLVEDIPLYEESNDIGSPTPDPNKSADYNMANHLITVMEGYGLDFYAKTAIEYTLKVENPKDRNGLLKRLKAMGFAEDIPYSQSE